MEASKCHNMHIQSRHMDAQAVCVLRKFNSKPFPTEKESHTEKTNSMVPRNSIQFISLFYNCLVLSSKSYTCISLSLSLFIIYKILTNWFLLVLKENLNIAPIHICHVYGISISPVEFPKSKRYELNLACRSIY